MTFGIKRMAAALLAAGCMLSLAAENALLKYIPAGTEYTVSVNLANLRALPGYAEITRMAKDQLEMFQTQYGISPESCSRLLFAGGGRKLRGLLIETTVPEAKLAELLRARPGSSTGTVEGRKAYFLQLDASLTGEARKIGLLYLSPEVVLATEEEYFPQFLRGLSASEELRRGLVEVPADEPPVWGCFNVASMLKKEKQNPGIMFLYDVRRILVGLTFPEGTAAEFKADALCNNPQAAQMIAQLVPSYMALGAQFAFAENPQLGADFLKAFRYSTEGTRTTVVLTVSDDLAGKLQEFGQSKIMPPDQVPDDVAEGQPAAPVPTPTGK